MYVHTILSFINKHTHTVLPTVCLPIYSRTARYHLGGVSALDTSSPRSEARGISEVSRRREGAKETGRTSSHRPGVRAPRRPTDTDEKGEHGYRAPSHTYRWFQYPIERANWARTIKVRHGGPSRSAGGFGCTALERTTVLMRGYDTCYIHFFYV